MRFSIHDEKGSKSGLLKTFGPILGFYTKVPILKEVTTEKCNSVELNNFSTYLSSLLGLIAIVFCNHAHKRGQICCQNVQLVRGSSFRNHEMTCYKIHTLTRQAKNICVLANSQTKISQTTNFVTILSSFNILMRNVK